MASLAEVGFSVEAVDFRHLAAHFTVFCQIPLFARRMTLGC
jgi:hypothetical protein